MKKIAKTVLKGTMRLGRGTATVMGLAMLLALTVGLASTALAGTGVGARFHPGQINTVDTVTRLVGSVTGATLTLDNNSTASGATALDLQVEKGKPPLNVNSNIKVERLNADTLDGNDSTNFLTSQSVANDSRRLGGIDAAAYFSKFTDTYQVFDFRIGAGGNSLEQTQPQCDPGDVVLNGGFSVGGFSVGGPVPPDNGAVVVRDHASSVNNNDAWLVQVIDVGDRSSIVGRATCADLPPLR